MALTVACRTSSFISFMRWKHAAAAVSSFFTAANHTTVKKDIRATSADQHANVQFTVFYRFPYIVAARLVSRLKLYQTAFVVSMVPVNLYYYHTGAVSLQICVGVGSASVLAMIMLYFAANFFQRVVGLVALSSDQKLVRLSHLTFFGGRNDVIVPVDDIVPLTDIDEQSGDIFVKVRRYSSPDTLYMTLRYGHVESAQAFTQVFGIVD